MITTQITIILLNLLILLIGGHILSGLKRIFSMVGFKLGLPISIFFTGVTFTCMASASEAVRIVVTMSL